MSAAEKLITEHLETWTASVKTKSSAGRGAGKKRELYGIKKLRELILELAVRGLLVPQDPNDEPASELLKRIASVKAKLIKDGEIKKQKKLPRINDSDIPFALPESWEWTRLGEATNYGKSDKAESSDVNESTWVLELEDIEKSTSKLLQKVRFKDRNFKSSKNRFRKNDVVYGKLRPYLDKVIVADEPGVCTTEMIPLRGYSSIKPEFLRLSMKTPSFIKYANDSTHGMNLPRMGTDKARAALIPLAPENEQRRIVAKVDELMELCDRLERETETQLDTHQTLVETLLAALTDAASTPAQLAQAWQRIAAHFDTLFTTESSIDHLKQTILQLAVMGKLVERKSSPDFSSLGELLSIASINGVSKGPTQDSSAIEVLKISAGTSRDDFYVDETDFKHVDLQSSEVEKYKLKPGDLLACRYNGNLHFVGKFSEYRGFTGKTQVNPDKLIRFRFDQSKYSPRYICFAMNSAQTRQTIEAMCATTAGNIGLSAGKIKTVKIPIPPLAEQRRIVAKVDELMSLCDALKAKLQAAQTTQLHLTDTLASSAVGN
ncbi:restriction endonuclease subunit S [Pelagicoccus sp. SDUM812002]|uniref:restriction endonuclease subunit S n=1 Tax=Pelagicoccus sp. SDUM812002 TaxID=3041266 RepID=UPI00280C71B7|nr:restriction endonuclease subunit S [Pelagicoccus sp. SDUM812002]MDQ8184305.1 restriction endonuclease subunit S [Pelagicoccus sp. SDUM812002]